MSLTSLLHGVLNCTAAEVAAAAVVAAEAAAASSGAAATVEEYFCQDFLHPLQLAITQSFVKVGG